MCHHHRQRSLLLEAFNSGRTGTGIRSSHLVTPHLVDDGHKWLTVSLGHGHTCGLTEDFDLYCWEHNGYAQVIGEPHPWDIIREIWSPVIVRPDLQWNNVVLGTSHSYGQTENSDLYVWGYNEDNHLGTEDPPIEMSSPRTLITDAYTWTELEGSNHTTCGISEGALYGWGVGNYGQLGLGSTTTASEPTRGGNRGRVDANQHVLLYNLCSERRGRLLLGRKLGCIRGNRLVHNPYAGRGRPQMVSHSCGTTLWLWHQRRCRLLLGIRKGQRWRPKSSPETTNTASGAVLSLSHTLDAPPEWRAVDIKRQPPCHSRPSLRTRSASFFLYGA